MSRPTESSDHAQALRYASDLRALYETSRAQTARYRLIVELGRDLIGSASLEALLNLALERVMAFSGHDGGSVLLIDERDGTLQVRASHGLDAIAPGTRVQDLERSAAGRTLLARSLLAISGRGEEIGTAWRTYAKSVPSSVCLPLLTTQGRPIGVLALKSTSQTRLLSPDDLDALQLLAGQLAAAIESAQLRERLQGSLDALLALHEAGQVLNASLDVEVVGQRLLDTAIQVAGLEAGVLRLYDERGRLRVWRSAGPEAVWRPAQRAASAMQSRRAALASGAPQSFLARGRSAQIQVLAGVCVPLRARGQVVGLLGVYGTEAAPGQATLEVLSSLADQAASALENARLYRALVERERLQHDLLGRLLLAQEEERRQVAYDIHDGLAQLATAAQQHLEAYAAHARPRAPQRRRALEQAIELSRGTVGEARRVIAGLRPTALDDFGLAAALRLEVEALRAEGWEVDYEQRPDVVRLPSAIETALFRVAQEALANVRKHAGPTRIQVVLRPQGWRVRLEVRDWGRGFRPSAVAGGGRAGERMGLTGIQERIALLGGRCTVRSRPGAGTRLVVEVLVPESLGGGGAHHVE